MGGRIMIENSNTYQEHMRRGNRYLEHNNLKKAEISFNNAHKIQTNNVQPLFKLVDIHTALGKVKEADALVELINDIIEKGCPESSSGTFPDHD